MAPTNFVASSQRQRPGVARHKSAEPLPPPPPPKLIDLSSSTKSTDRETGNKITRRAFLCDVVVEREGEETANLLAHLGEPLKPLSTLPPPPPSTNGRPTTPSRLALPPDSDDERDGASPGWTGARKDEMTHRLSNLIDELVRTERSYLSRVHALKTSYADRLRLFARDPNQQLIPPYEAKAMFANIEAIVPASAAFLTDLDAMLRSGKGEETVGDICLRHFKDLRTFDPYRTYLSKQDESQKMFQESLRKFPGFVSFIESTKYQTTGIGNIGLRELLMEPVQRIPRYTLLWQTMVKCMSPLSTQRAKLLEATEIASRIARCEPDAQTVRATVMYHLERNIDDFPAKLFSNNRDYIDSIDVEDLPAEYPTASSPPSRPLSTISSRPLSMSSASTHSMASLGSLNSNSHLPQSPPSNSSTMATLHCSLFLFDDKLMIVKRQSSSVSGRKVTGTDDVQKLVRTGGGVAVIDKHNVKKDKLSFRGEVDVLDVIASDIGGGDFHLFFERPPADQSGRWSGRPFRSYTTVHPPYAVSLDPYATKRDKSRFVQNLWAAQALARAKLLPKHVRAVPRVLMSAEEVELEAAGDPFGRAKCFWDVWDKNVWSNVRKAKVVIHVDEDGFAPDIPMVEGSYPLLSIRLQPVAGGLCRFSSTTTGDDDDERVVIAMNEVTTKIATTVHRYGIFKFKTGTTSCPTTPSAASHRLRPSMLNLDAISRNLFGAGSVSGKSGTSSDMFSTSSSKRGSKTFASRSSTMDTSRFSSESHEETTRKRLSRQSSSPELDSLVAGAPYQAGREEMGQSEIDLNERLNLARNNSKSIASQSPGPSRLGVKSVAELRGQVEERAKMEEAEASLRATLESPPAISATAPLHIRKTPSPTRPFTPAADLTPVASLNRPTSPSTEPLRRTPTLAQSILPAEDVLFTSPRQIASPPPPPSSSTAPLSPRPSTAPLSPRPIGPRSPIPGPRNPPPRLPTQTPILGSAHTKLRIVSGGGRRISLGRETVPLKGGDENDSLTQTTPTILITKRQHSSDQLSPRKRSPTRSPLYPREASDPSQILPDPLNVPSFSKKPGTRRVSGNNRQTPRRSSGPLTTPRTVSASQASVTSVATATTVDDVEMSDHPDMRTAMDSTRKKIRDARGSTKRLKSEMSNLRKQMTKDSKGKDLAARLDHNSSLPRSPQRRNINRMADYDTTHDSISSRQSSSGRKEIDAIVMDECARGIVSIAERIDAHLKQAEGDSDQAAVLAKRLAQENEARLGEIRALQSQVQRSKEHQDLLQRQLGDAQIELDVIYEAFNTELDGMFNDAQLPETEAFQALRNNLQVTKADRNVLKLENTKLKRELEEANLKREQWARMLRAQGYEV
nr:uncharacterized protein CI109_002240 [Kwoniella shandongensis]KAA5529347.1 hypothetical protein CI109_002240 [Kwoniella shandongensis]